MSQTLLVLGLGFLRVLKGEGWATGSETGCDRVPGSAGQPPRSSQAGIT